MSISEIVFRTDLAFSADFVKTASGDLDTVTGLDNLKQALYARLVTTKGSLVHRPNYGVGIKSYVNSLSSLSNKQKLALEIKEQYEQDPRVEEVTGVFISEYSVDTPETFYLKVNIKPVGYDETPMEFVPFGVG